MPVDPAPIHYVVPDGDEEPIASVLWRLAADVRPRFRIIPYADFLEARAFANGAWIFANPYVLDAGESARVAEICAAMRAHLPGVELINLPESVLDRHALLEALHADGENSFRPFRLSSPLPEDARFPVFLREWHHHTGCLTGLLHSHAEVEEAVRRLSSWAREDLLALEYCHTADELGIFRKYSAVRIGDAIVPFCVYFNDHWEVKYSEHRACGHEDVFSTEALMAEEMRYLEENPHEARLRTVFEVAGIEYGRIDYSMLGDRLQVWEINTYPSYGGDETHEGCPISEFQTQRKPAKSFLFGQMSDAWAALASDAPADMQVECPPNQAVVNAAQARRDRVRRSERLRRLLLTLRRTPGLKLLGPLPGRLRRRALGWLRRAESR